MNIKEWDKKYCKLAKHISSWSKDPSRRIGAITVGKDGQILSQGYNGFPRKITDTDYRLNKRELKLKYVVHAEMNCIYNACLNGVSLKDSTLYVYGLPVCSECSKGVIQVGISRVVMYTPDRTKNLDDDWGKSFNTLTSEMFNEAGINYVWYDLEATRDWNESR